MRQVNSFDFFFPPRIFSAHLSVLAVYLDTHALNKELPAVQDRIHHLGSDFDNVVVCEGPDCIYDRARHDGDDIILSS